MKILMATDLRLLKKKYFQVHTIYQRAAEQSILNILICVFKTNIMSFNDKSYSHLDLFSLLNRSLISDVILILIFALKTEYSARTTGNKQSAYGQRNTHKQERE